MNRQLECASLRAFRIEKRKRGYGFVEFNDGLHSAFAEALLVTDDDGATIILQCCRKNLASRSAQAVHQDDHRTAIGNFGISITADGDFAARILGLNDGALGDEKSG